jgi:hypothetical protein
MVIFNSYVSLPEGIPRKNMFFWDFLGFPMTLWPSNWPSNSWDLQQDMQGTADQKEKVTGRIGRDVEGIPHWINEGWLLIYYGLILCYNFGYEYIYIHTYYTHIHTLYIFSYVYNYIYSYISTHFCTSWSTSAFPAAEAFKKLLREWHPDKNVDRVQVCTAVFQCLSDAIPGEPLGLLGIWK